MTVSVDVVDHTGLVADHAAVRGLVEAVLSAEGLSGEVAVAFVDEAAIADLNERYRDAQGSTDVLSFDYRDEEVPGAGSEQAATAGGAARGGVAAPPAEVSGELVISPQVVVRYAGEEARDPRSQMGWTIIHGVLHLAGYDHETDRGEMWERERVLLRLLDERVGALVVAGAAG